MIQDGGSEIENTYFSACISDGCEFSTIIATHMFGVENSKLAIFDHLSNHVEIISCSRYLKSIFNNRAENIRTRF